MKQETTRDEELFQNNLMHRGYIKDFLKKQSKKIVTLQVKLEKEKYDHEDTTAEFRRLELAIWDALTPQEKVKECLSHYPDIDKMLDVAFRDADATVSEEEVVNSNTHERKANIVINLCGERFSVPKGSFRLDFYELGYDIYDIAQQITNSQEGMQKTIGTWNPEFLGGD